MGITRTRYSEEAPAPDYQCSGLCCSPCQWHSAPQGSSTPSIQFESSHRHLIMTASVLVKAYSGTTGNTSTVSSARPAAIQPLPPVSSYAFADILRSADCPEFQHAINGIAEICAKSRLSLADEYASHLPPLGEITAANSSTMRPHLMRSGMRRPLTSVPEASSGSSEGSGKAKKRKTAAGSLWQQDLDGEGTRRMQIGRMGRSISVGGTVALVKYEDLSSLASSDLSPGPIDGHGPTAALSRQRTRGDAAKRLRGLLGE